MQEQEPQRYVIDLRHMAGLLYVTEYNVHHAAKAVANAFQQGFSGRQLPDKAVDLLDMTAARVRVERYAKPEALVDIEQQIAGLQRKEEALKRDIDSGEPELEESLNETVEALAKLREDRAQLTERWQNISLINCRCGNGGKLAGLKPAGTLL